MEEFVFSILEQVHVFVLITLLTGALYYAAARKTAVNLSDPWMVQQALTTFATATVLFMAWIGSIGIGIAAYHVAASVLFFAIASYHPPRWQTARAERRKPWRLNPRQVGRMQVAVFVLLLVSQLAMWAVTGLPILLASRLDAAATGGGVGVLSRFVAVFTTAVIFLTVVRIGQRGRHYRWYRDGTIMLLVLLLQVGSGSKSAIVYTVLFFLTSEWLCARMARNHRPLRIRAKYVVVSLLAVSLLTLVPLILENVYFTSSTSTNPFMQLLLRGVLSGDAYVWFLGDRYLWTIQFGSPSLILFGDFLGSFRLVPREALPMHPGLALTRYLWEADVIAGPNMRLDLFGYLYGGALPGLLFVAAAAAVFNLMRRSVFVATRIERLLLSVFLFFSAPAVFVDPTLATGALLNAALAWPVLALLAVASSPRTRRRGAATPPTPPVDATLAPSRT